MGLRDMIHPMDDKTGFEATDEELFGKTVLCGDCHDYRKVEAMFNICANLILGSLTVLFLIEIAGSLFEVFMMSVLT